MDTVRQNAALPDNSTVSLNATIWVIPPNPGRSLQADVAVCAIATFLIATSLVALRFYTRGRLNHVLGPSDWCIVPALLCAAGVTASSLEQMFRGAGKHYWEVDLAQVEPFERASWYGMLFYNLSLSLTRISILLLYKRIFTHTWIKRTIQVALVIVTAIGIWLVVSVCTACVPLQAFWDWSLFYTTLVYCQPANMWWANGALHIGSDLVIMALPLPVLSSLNIPKRHKYAIVAVFALGFCVCLISIVRLVNLIRIEEQQSVDATYTSANMIFWTTVEVNAAISCACIMTLKPLIQRVFPRILSPSKGFREPQLPWITPVNNHTTCTTTNTNNRNERHSFARVSSTSRPRTSTQSSGPRKSHVPQAGSGTGSASRRRYDSFQARDDHLEKSRYYHGILKPDSPGADGVEGYDLDRELDLEAQRTCSDLSLMTTTTTSMMSGTATDPDKSNGRPRNLQRDDNGGLFDRGGDNEPLDPVASLRAPPKAHLRLSIHVTRSVVVEKWPRSPTPTPATPTPATPARVTPTLEDDRDSRGRWLSRSENGL